LKKSEITGLLIDYDCTSDKLAQWFS